MFDAWLDLPWWLRLGVAAVIFIAGVLVFLFVNIRLGIILAGVGLAMFAFGGRSRSEKSGYHF